MASSRELSRLFSALRDGNLDAARAEAEAIAVLEEQAGHGGAAQRFLLEVDAIQMQQAWAGCDRMGRDEALGVGRDCL